MTERKKSIHEALAEVFKNGQQMKGQYIEESTQVEETSEDETIDEAILGKGLNIAKNIVGGMRGRSAVGMPQTAATLPGKSAAQIKTAFPQAATSSEKLANKAGQAIGKAPIGLKVGAVGVPAAAGAGIAMRDNTKAEKPAAATSDKPVEKPATPAAAIPKPAEKPAEPVAAPKPAAPAAEKPVSSVQTKGGAFPVFKKGGEASQSFQSAYKAATPGSTFKWKGAGETGPEREYKAAPAPKTSSVPTPPVRPTEPDKKPAESESGGKDKAKKIRESALIDAFLKLQDAKNSNIFEAAKKAKKDWDKDGKIESDKDEVWGSRMRAAKMAGKMQEAVKKESGASSDPDMAAPRPSGEKYKDEIQYKAKSVPTPPPAGAADKARLNAKMREEVEQIDELDRQQGSILNRYISKTNPDYSSPKEVKKRAPGRALALKKKWGDEKYGLPEPKVKAVQREEIEFSETELAHIESILKGK